MLKVETFKVSKQTSSAIPLLAEYLLHDVGLDYVFPGRVQSDFLVKRFGRYKQLNGTNYFADKKEFFETENLFE